MTTSRIDNMLAAARGRLRRLDARQVPVAVRRGAVLVDIRPEAQREREGAVPAALVVERNVLEWRCDPTSDARLPQAVDDNVEWVVLCSEGYTSSLAAAALHDLGLSRATDVVGGYWALAATGALAELGLSCYSGAFTTSRSRSVFSGVHPGGCRTCAQPLTTSLT
jgi:rhodanese-related sulfurtransferase